MSKVSFPNQDQVTIHKERYDGNFLQVSIDEWTTAFNNLKPGTFGLYLYLCGNMDFFPTPPIMESSEMTAAAAPVASEPCAPAPQQQERPLRRFPSSRYVTATEYDWVD